MQSLFNHDYLNTGHNWHRSTRTRSRALVSVLLGVYIIMCGSVQATWAAPDGDTHRTNETMESAINQQTIDTSTQEEHAWSPGPEERLLLRLINDARTHAGLAAVELDATLSQVARDHAREMIELEYFAHISPHSGSVAARLRAADVQFSHAGENLGGHTSARAVHQALLHSPGHRSNILSATARHVGLAYVRGGPYGAMIVELFVTPNPPKTVLETE